MTEKQFGTQYRPSPATRRQDRLHCQPSRRDRTARRRPLWLDKDLRNPAMTKTMLSEFLSKYFRLRSEPIFDVVTVFTAPFFEKPIRTDAHYVLGQFERAFVGFRG